MPTENLKKPSLVSVLFGALFVCAVWLAIVQPWSQSAASPLTVAITSALAAGMLMAWRRTALGSGASDDVRARYGVLKDLALAFTIMAFMGLLFLGLNSYLESEAAADQSLTLRQVLEMQRQAAALSTWLGTFAVAAKIGAIALILALVLLVAGAGKAFDRVSQARKWIKQTFRLTTLTILCFGSFSLSGGELASAVARDRSTRAFALNSSARQNLDRLESAVRNEIAGAITDKLVAEVRPDCGQAHEQCANDPVAALGGELERAGSWRDEWPRRPDRYNLPPEPSSLPVFGEADSVRSALASLPEGPAAAHATLAPAVESQPIVAVQTAVQALPGSAATPPREKRLRDVVALALSVGLETAGISLSPNVDETLGRFVSKAAGTISGAVQAQMEGLVRDVVVDIVSGCRNGARACSEAVRNRLRAMRNDARLTDAAHRIAQATRSATTRFALLATRIANLNQASDAGLRRALAQVERGEGEGEWGGLRRRWTSDLRAGRLTDLTPAQHEGWLAFVNRWAEMRPDVARSMMRDGLPGRAEDWNRAFLGYLRSDPDAAAIFGYMVLNDLPIRPFLMERQPAVVNRTVRVADAYALFASTIEGQSWSPAFASEDTVLAHSFGFRDAVGRYCPHAGGL